ncbi:MAG: response regulator transcription factor [Trueperaceae bacterium]|nr:response regulator transcription factor [Trueperaceae bacterium]
MDPPDLSRTARAAARILVVEDDARLRSLLEQELATDGHVVVAVGTAGEGLYRAEEEPYDLLVLDLSLPDGDGLEVAERLRDRRDVPILMLTARADVDSRVRGLYAGAADYMTKPFSVPELLARVHARLRERLKPERPRHRDLELDPSASVARGPGGEAILPESEFALLRMLVEHPGRLFTRDEIERRLYVASERPGSNTVEVFVHHVRRKLEQLDAEPRIRTVRGKGYMLR